MNADADFNSCHSTITFRLQKHGDEWTLAAWTVTDGVSEKVMDSPPEMMGIVAGRLSLAFVDLQERFELGGTAP
jgi:hypothetical protein